MKRTSVIVALAVFFALALPVKAMADPGLLPPSGPAPTAQTIRPDPTMVELIELAKQYDQMTVTVKGEVVGDIMRRGEHVWLNVNDGTMTMGVFAPASVLADVKTSGGYQSKGDTVAVKGTFYRSDPAQGGETYINADTVRVEAGGARAVPTVQEGHLALLAVTGVACLALGLLFWRRQARLAHE